jgi:hypothetical protein
MNGPTPSRKHTVSIATLAVLLTWSVVASASAKPAKKSATKATKSSAKPGAKPVAGSAASSLEITVVSNDWLSKNVKLTVPAGTTAKKLKDSPSTLVTFRDGAQMLATPDPLTAPEYRTIITDQSKSSSPNEAIVILVDAVDHFTFVDKIYSQVTGGVSFYANKDLPDLVVNTALARGVLCTNHGTADTKQTANQKTIDAMIAACLSAKPA